MKGGGREGQGEARREKGGGGRGERKGEEGRVKREYI
jgi:hypothetical protein